MDKNVLATITDYLQFQKKSKSRIKEDKFEICHSTVATTQTDRHATTSVQRDPRSQPAIFHLLEAALQLYFALNAAQIEPKVR